MQTDRQKHACTRELHGNEYNDNTAEIFYRGSNGNGNRCNSNTTVTGINAAVLPRKWGEMRRK